MIWFQPLWQLFLRNFLRQLYDQVSIGRNIVVTLRRLQIGFLKMIYIIPWSDETSGQTCYGCSSYYCSKVYPSINGEGHWQSEDLEFSRRGRFDWRQIRFPWRIPFRCRIRRLIGVFCALDRMVTRQAVGENWDSLEDKMFYFAAPFISSYN